MKTNILKKIYHSFLGVAERLEFLFPYLKINLAQSELKYKPREYIALTVANLFFVSLAILLFGYLVLSGMRLMAYFPLAMTVLVLIIVLMFFQKMAYPKYLAARRVRNIEGNLLPALRNIVVQMNSGVPLFDVMVSISADDYGQISKEFKKVVKEIDTGVPQIEVLERLASNNPSLYFRRAVWQMINGVKAGGDISKVLNEVIHHLSEEQLDQIQGYGSSLNPLAMFYMLTSVILPALAITFLIVITSFLSVPQLTTKMFFWVLLLFVIVLQFLFIGLIKSKRPTLLRE